MDTSTSSEMAVPLLDADGATHTVTLHSGALLRTLFDLAVQKQPNNVAARASLCLVPPADSHSPAALSVGRVDPSKLDGVTVREMSDLVPAHFAYTLAFSTAFSCLCHAPPVTLLFDMRTTLAQLKARYLQLWWSREGGGESVADGPHRTVTVYLSAADRDAGVEMSARDDQPFAEYWLSTGCSSASFHVRVIASAQPSSSAEAPSSIPARPSSSTAKPSSSSYELFIQMLTGRSFTVAAEPTDSVAVVKLRIQQSESILVDQQRLVFGGRQLQDACTLEECGVRSGGLVHLVLKLC